MRIRLSGIVISMISQGFDARTVSTG